MKRLKDLSNSDFHPSSRQTIRSCRAARTLLLFALLLFCHPLAAHRRFTHLSLEDGLSQSVVNAITQDRDGLLWIGTQDGLNRYDGVQFRVLRRDSDVTDSLPDSHISALLTDAQGDVWVGTYNGLARVRAGTFRPENFPFANNSARNSPARNVLSLARDAQDNIWIGTASGLWQWQRQGGLMLPVAAENSLHKLAERRVRSLYYQASKARLWIGTDKGVQWLDNGGVWSAPDSLQGMAVNKLLALQDGQFLIGTREGLYRYDEEKDQLQSQKTLLARCNAQVLSQEAVQDLLQDSNGDIWMATTQGVLVSDARAQHCEWYQRIFHQPDSLSTNDSLSLYMDRGGVLWIGSFAGGLNRWNTRSKLFDSVLDPEVAAANAATRAVMTVLRGRDGDLWVGTSDLGLLHQAQGQSGFVTEKLPVPSGTAVSINALAQDFRGRVWIGTVGHGLLLREKDGRIRSVYQEAGLNSDDYISNIVEDRRGHLWLGNTHGVRELQTDEHGVVSYRDYDDLFPPEFRESDAEISSIVDDRDGSIWFAGTSGLLHLDAARKSMSYYGSSSIAGQRLSDNDVQALTMDSSGELWVATANGLNRVFRRPEGGVQIEQFSTESGLPVALINALASDERGGLWLASNSGLLRFDPLHRSYMRFHVEDGLLSEEFNTRAQSVGSDGELLFGGIGGVIAFHPQQLALPSAPPAPVLVGWHKFDKEQAVPESGLPIEFNSDDRVVTLDFAVADYVAVARNRLRYRMRGVNDNWVHLEGTRSVTLSGLEPGSYALEVSGSANAAIWSEQPSVLSIVVRGPFWNLQRQYALALLSLLLCSAVVVWWLLRRQQLQRLRDQAALHTANQLLQQMQRDNSELRVENKQLQAVSSSSQGQLRELAEQLDQSTIIDSLTGLPNRHACLVQLTQLATQGGDVLLIDLDGLRLLNEHYGCHAGDQILVQLASLLTKICVTQAQVFRLSEDVFVVLRLSRTNVASDVAVFAEKIRSAVLQRAFHLAQRRRIDLSCCVGFVHASAAIAAPEILLALAERAVILCKRSGRNAWLGFRLPKDATSLQAGFSSIRAHLACGELQLLTSLPGGEAAVVWQGETVDVE